MDNKIQELYKLWKDRVTDDELLRELSEIEGCDEEISDRFYTELSFGTAGLRGVIGAGTNRMNIYTVGRVTQGLADCINEKNDGERSVSVSYDPRINSELFAKHAASVLAANGIKVYITPVLEPTPVLSFMVRYYHSEAGIMITASHNPAKYNGYKCYGPDGCQMTDVYADRTTEFVNKVDYFGTKYMDFDEGIKSGIIEYTDDKMLECYYAQVEKRVIDKDICKSSGLQVLYSPLNGTGNIPVREMLSRLGVICDIVPEQEKPDGRFPTTPFPNPEFPQAFELGMNIAKEKHPDLILATDPDADRVGIAVRNSEGGYSLMSGNEVGCMLTYYILSRKKELGILPKDAMCIKSIVSSDLATKIAHKFSCRMVDVLTGFKYIGEQIKLLEDEGREDEFQLGFEESYGYLSGSYVRDKDAVVASALICEMAAYCKSCGKSLIEYMDEIYREFGVFRHKTISASFDGASGMEKMKDILASLRKAPPAEVCGMKVEKILDFKTHISLDTATGKTETIDLPASDVLLYRLEKDCSLVIRPSGTEPKIKAYLTACAETLEKADSIVFALEQEAKKIFA